MPAQLRNVLLQHIPDPLQLQLRSWSIASCLAKLVPHAVILGRDSLREVSHWLLSLTDDRWVAFVYESKSRKLNRLMI